MGIRPVTQGLTVVSAIDLRLPHLLYCGLGADGRIVHFFKSIRPCLRAQDWKDLDVPVVVVVNRLPVPEILGRMQTARRGMQHKMKFLSNGAHALQSSPQKSRKVHPQSWLVQSGSLEGSVVVARHDPGFIGDARGVWSQRQIVPSGLDDALGLSLLLLDDVAEDAPFLAHEVLSAGSQLV